MIGVSPTDHPVSATMPLPFCLPEFSATATNGRGRMLVVVQTTGCDDARFVVDWLGRYGPLGDTRLIQDQGTVYLLLLSDMLTDFDQLLLPLEYLLSFWSMARSAAQTPQMVDSRLVTDSFCLDNLRDAAASAAMDDLWHRYNLRFAAGTVFGSGSHPSTRLAIRAMEECVAEGGAFPARLLDVGCGSGILAMVGARLGATRVLAVDSSPQALACASANVVENGLEGMVRVTGGAVAKLDAEADVVVANLAISVLTGLWPFLAACCAVGGTMICSGFVAGQCDTLRHLAKQDGFGVRKELRQGRWRAFVLRKERRGR